MNTFEFEAIGTKWQIDLYESWKVEKQEFLFKKILKRIDEFDKVYSRFRADSLVAKMSQKKGMYTLPEDSKKLFEIYHNFYRLTDGAMTPLIGQALADAGYDANYSLKSKKLKQPESWDKIISFRYPKLTLNKPALLDFGAAGKGYLIDLIGDLLKQENVCNFCIDAGGDILYHRDQKFLDGVEPMKIGLENPVNTAQVIGVVVLKNQSICGSAGNRRKWGEFNHMINPFSLQSPKDILATWVIADTAIEADALATALFFVSFEKLKMDYNFKYVLLKQDFSIEKSINFPGEFFYN